MPTRTDSLTPRQLEVAALIAMGETNAEIAHDLGVELSTAETHVHHILSALGFRSRTQIASWWGGRSLKNQ